MTVSDKDIERIHNRLDEAAKEQKATNKVLGELSISVATIATKIEERPRPCHEHQELRRDHDAHIEEHKATQRTWQQSVIRAVVDVVKVAVVGLVCFWIGAR